MNRRLILLTAVVVASAVGLIGLAYAFQATIDTNSTLTNGYVTLTMEDSDGNPLDGYMFSYDQDYDTVTSSSGVTTFKMITSTSTIHLNSDACTVRIQDSKAGSGEYTVKGKVTNLPSLQVSPDIGDLPYFYITLTSGSTVYTSQPIANAAEFSFLDSNGDEVPCILEGEYTVDAYLQMPVEPVIDGFKRTIEVSKELFVDRFSKVMNLTLTARPYVAPGGE